MGRIKVIGLGPGDISLLTIKGREEIINSDIIIGGERHLREIKFLVANKELYTLGKLSELKGYLDKKRDKDISIVVSGDTGYYSLLRYIKKIVDKELEVIPGISSYQYLFAKLGLSWEGYTLCSIHGRECDYEEKLKNSELGIVLLTDNKNTPSKICKELKSKGYRGLEIIIGENLSYPNERIDIFMIDDFNESVKDYQMNVMVIRKG